MIPSFRATSQSFAQTSWSIAILLARRGRQEHLATPYWLRRSVPVAGWQSGFRSGF